MFSIYILHSLVYDYIVFFRQPLHHAARGEHAEVIQLLLANGASPTKTNTYGKVSHHTRFSISHVPFNNGSLT